MTSCSNFRSLKYLFVLPFLLGGPVTGPHGPRCRMHYGPTALLHCTALHCTALHCTVLYCTVLYCTVLYCTVLHSTALHWLVTCLMAWRPPPPRPPARPQCAAAGAGGPAAPHPPSGQEEQAAAARTPAAGIVGYDWTDIYYRMTDSV